MPENNYADWYVENAETYPTPIARWDGWWADKCRRVREATNEAEISAVLAQVEPYAKAKWIYGSRPDELRKIAADRRKQWRQSP